jgi:hypothetical protein
MKFEVKWVNSVSEISQELWDKCFPFPYEGSWWYKALELSGLQDQFKFFYAVVSNSSQSIAIAPAFMMNVPVRLVLPPSLLPLANVVGYIFPSVLYQRTLFIGSPCSDEGRVGMLAGVNRLEVLRSIDHAMNLKAKILNVPMRVWKDFPKEYAEDFTELSADLFPLVSYPGTLAQLPNSSKDAYMASLKASRRNKLNKKIKRVIDAPVDVEIIHQPNITTMDDIFSLFWQTYEKGNIKFERLTRKFFDLLAENKYTYFVILRERTSSNMVAFMLCFALGKHVINKFIGIDYQKPREWFLYFKLWDAAIDWSTAQGATSIQSGQTVYAPKIELGHELVPLSNYCAHQNPIIHWIYAKMAKTVNWDTLDGDLALYLQAYPEHRPKV